MFKMQLEVVLSTDNNETRVLLITEVIQEHQSA